MFFVTFTIITMISIFFAMLFLMASEMFQRDNISFFYQNMGYITSLWSLILCLFASVYNNNKNYKLHFSVLLSIIGLLFSYFRNNKRHFQLQSKLKQRTRLLKTTVFLLLLLLWGHKIMVDYFYHLHYVKVDFAIYVLSAAHITTSFFL
jgi:hypothetical protein